MNETPLSHQRICTWCESGVSASAKICESCFMPVDQAPVKNTATSTKEIAKKEPSSRKKKVIVADSPAIPELSPIERINLAIKEGRIIVVGIDPGARYVGFCVRDNEGVVFISSTFRRPDEMPEPYDWARKVIILIAQALEGIEYHVMGIEGTVDPKGFKYGKKDALNPKDIIRTAAVAGGLAIQYLDAYIIRPRGNGDKPSDQYPEALVGRRPASLGGSNDPGVTTRNHERSAYDVAEHALFENLQSQPAK